MKTQKIYKQVIGLTFVLFTSSVNCFAQIDESSKVELLSDLSNLQKHENFIVASNPESKELQETYNNWIKDNPKVWQIPLAIGNSLKKKDIKKSYEYLLKAVENNPNLHDTWLTLSLNAYFNGDKPKAISHMENALKGDPDNIRYLMQYAAYFKESNPKKFREISLKIADNPKKDVYSCYTLLLLAQAEKNQEERFKVYERVKAEYSDEVTPIYHHTMSYYFDELYKIDPSRASKLAASLLELKTVKLVDQWESRAINTSKISQADIAFKKKDYKQAKEILKDVTLSPDLIANKLLLLFNAEIEHNLDNTEGAYRMLLTAFLEKPDALLKEAIDTYAADLDKTKEMVNKEIYATLYKNVKAATPFSLRKYEDDKLVSLADLKGKVVFITYWYPGCGPCREEFPHFENVLKKFNKSDVVYLGLNVTKSQNELVMPFIKGNPYSFVPLDDTKPRDKGNLDNKLLAPVNFLIDREGNLVFSQFRTLAQNESELEAMIQLLVDKK